MRPSTAIHPTFLYYCNMTSSEIRSNVYGNHIKLSDAANELLSEHSHLDLTERVQLVDESIRGHGGCADVYYGRLMDSGKYVAVKRLRVHFQKEQQLSKAYYIFCSLPRMSLTNICRTSLESLEFGHFSVTPTSSHYSDTRYMVEVRLHS